MAAILYGVYYFIVKHEPKPVPRDKENYIGKWHSLSGFQLEIQPSGTSNLIQIANAMDSDYEKLNIMVTPKMIKGMLVEFKGDSILTVIDPFNYAIEYKINKIPYLESDTFKMILNGVVMKKY